MTTPPRTAELFLETLGAEPALRDAVVGDLAEEFAWIADTVGERDARRWYRRETLRALPLLLRSSLRSTTWGDVRRRAGLAFSAFAFASIINVVLSVVVSVLFQVLAGVPFGQQPTGLLMLIAYRLLLAIPPALMLGYVAAWLDDRTPLLSAVTLAVPWLGVRIAHSAIHGWPLGQMIPQSLLFAGLIVLGGMLQLRHRTTHKARGAGIQTN